MPIRSLVHVHVLAPLAVPLARGVESYQVPGTQQELFHRTVDPLSVAIDAHQVGSRVLHSFTCMYVHGALTMYTCRKLPIE